MVKEQKNKVLRKKHKQKHFHKNKVQKIIKKLTKESKK